MNKIIKHYYQAFVLSLLAVFVIALGGIANGVHAHPLVVNQAVPSATIAAAVQLHTRVRHRTLPSLGMLMSLVLTSAAFHFVTLIALHRLTIVIYRHQTR
jgi:hypothetical protein